MTGAHRQRDVWLARRLSPSPGHSPPLSPADRDRAEERHQQHREGCTYVDLAEAPGPLSGVTATSRSLRWNLVR